MLSLPALEKLTLYALLGFSMGLPQAFAVGAKEISQNDRLLFLQCEVANIESGQALVESHQLKAIERLEALIHKTKIGFSSGPHGHNPMMGEAIIYRSDGSTKQISLKGGVLLSNDRRAISLRNESFRLDANKALEESLLTSASSAKFHESVERPYDPVSELFGLFKIQKGSSKPKAETAVYELDCKLSGDLLDLSPQSPLVEAQRAKPWMRVYFGTGSFETPSTWSGVARDLETALTFGLHRDLKELCVSALRADYPGYKYVGVVGKPEETNSESLHFRCYGVRVSCPPTNLSAQGFLWGSRSKAFWCNRL